ncbi:MAG: tetratricopeptide repeat protein [Woeseiaceae bacterium]|nr:tetratricopeptide repeat protein [Woeseiaceae bacterium]NIP19926.1 tetratricopeptide repeat protein [Woeseiaceae bacterium]NIS88727.1 tetratricopeptide repeat protein [Woeseiaceae bacterium]
MDFFSELQRRNVLRLAATYALVAWILIEAGSVLLPTFGVPEWFFRAWVITIFLGFVVALVLAWVFEVTPEGVKFDSQVDHDNQPPKNRSRSNTIIIALLAIALGVSITFNVTGIRNQPEVAGEAVPGNSIAVLPFTNRSADPENQFFADGMHDDLLTRLADIDSLRVISRTSVNEYRDTNKNLREIGAELGVETIVEGAVQRIGDQVRITVQLIDAATDEHIWAESYDRALTASNVFQIQSDISAQIAASLQATLTPEEEVRLAVIPTHSIEALSMYTSARNNLYLRRYDTLLEARDQFERAIEIDPEYAQAYAGLAESVLVLEGNHKAISFHEAQGIAEEAVAKALELDGALAEAYAVRGLLEFHRYKLDRLGNGGELAAAAYERAIALNPNLASAYVWYGNLREAERSDQEAIELYTTAMEIDPLGRVPYMNLPNIYSRLGKHDKAIQFLLKSIAIFPDWHMPSQMMAYHLMGLGRLDEALAWYNGAISMTDDPIVGSGATKIYIEFGDSEGITAIASRFPEDHPFYPIGESVLRFMNNDFAGAIEAIEAVEQDGEISDIQARFSYPIVAVAAAILGDYEKSRDYLLRVDSGLASDAAATVDHFNYKNAILLAYINRKLNREREASELLAQAWNLIQDMPRLGVSGHGISDVHVLAIQGRKEAALEALQAAVDEGFVSLMSFENWTLDQDVLLDDLRGDPRFEAIRQQLHDLIEIMRDNAQDAHATGDWSELQNRVRGQLTAAVRL